jgi:outer membrane protein assembly factor BamD
VKRVQSHGLTGGASRAPRAVGLAVLCGSLLLAGCLRKKHLNPQETQGAPVSDSVAPDKVLYSRALDDINKGHYEVARLALQSLINTYPESEYLAKAKLSIADSFYKEGGESGLSQSVLEYKDFITFFPFLDECAYAQMQIGMAHYRRVEKPDRDRTEAEAAEEEFQVFLTKYPSSPLVPQVEQQLRNVQEILAEGDFRIAQYYYTKESYRAAAGRLLEVASRYPLFSDAAKANWMLAGIYERNEKTQYAGLFYSRIVSQYPLSPYAAGAKERLTKLGLPIPAADPNALARMQKEQNTPRPRPTLVARTLGPLESRPNMNTAARVGTPNMNPPDENAELETLMGSSGFNITATGPGGASGSATSSGSGSTNSDANGSAAGSSTAGGDNPTTLPSSAAVEIVTPGKSPTPGPAANAAAGGTGGAGSEAGTAAVSSTAAAASGDPASAAAQPAHSPNSASGGASATPAPKANPQNNQQPCPPANTSTANAGSNQQNNTSTNSANTQQQGCQPAKNGKKKGLKKIIPW